MEENWNPESNLGLTELLNLWESGTLTHPREREPLLPKLASEIRTSRTTPNELRTSYRVVALKDKEFDETLENMRETIRGGLTKSGAHRRENWESGWSENLAEARSANFTAGSILPKYFREDQLQRFNNRLYFTEGIGFEPDFLSVLVDGVICHEARKLGQSQAQVLEPSERTIVAEFGCGTGHHLIRLAQSLSESQFELVGLDWAKSSQLLLQEFTATSGREIRGYNFDYFAPVPPKPWKLDSTKERRGQLFFTVASLEQVGDQHESFIKFCIDQNPDVVVHFEPIAELLSHDALGDISREYFAARNYLSGFLDSLEKLEERGLLKILSAERAGFGSQFTEGYSLIRWSPVSQGQFNK